MRASTAEKVQAERVYLIDEIRGFAIICMVVYHTFFDLVESFNVSELASLFYSAPIQFLVVVFVFVFVFISGTASEYSRNNLKRGAICFALGMAMTIGTYIIMPRYIILFGILHMLGISMILFSLTKRYLHRISPYLLIVLGVALFLLTYNLQSGYLGFGEFSIRLPRELYELGFLFPLGFASDSFFSSDYFALLPWLFCFLAGSGFGRLLKQKKLPSVFYKSHLKLLGFVGRNTLLIYVLHQPVIYSALFIIFRIIRK